MKRYTPYIFPAIVFVIVIFLIWRWYGLRAERAAQRLDFGEGVQIENLTDSERDAVKNGVGDVQTVELERPQPSETTGDASESAETEEAMKQATGVFRYEVQNNRVVFSVIAELPKPTEGRYQVWLKSTESETVKKAFVLEQGKGGYEGSAAVSAELLPFEVVVSKEMTDDATVEEVVLRGLVQAAAPAAESADQAKELE